MRRLALLCTCGGVSLIAMAACTKPETSNDPFPDKLECPYPGGIEGSYSINFKDIDVVVGGGYRALSLTKSRGWKVSLGLLDRSAGVARFDVNPRGRLEKDEVAPESFTVRMDSDGRFSVTEDYKNNDPAFSEVEVPCYVYSESDNANS